MRKKDTWGEAQPPWENSTYFKGKQTTFMNWLRGQLRRGSSRYPEKNEFLRENRFRKTLGTYKNGKPKSVWAGTCNMCGEDFKQSELAVDHIIPAGSLLDEDDIQSYITRLFCHKNNFQFLCKDCHGIKTYVDKLAINGITISFEDARRAQKWIAIGKLKIAQQKTYIKKAGGSEEDIKNKTNRDKFLKGHFNIYW